jgi:hypothetical protein
MPIKQEKVCLRNKKENREKESKNKLGIRVFRGEIFC